MAKADHLPDLRRDPSAEYKPFCSRGCKDRDLLQWLGEGYRLPGRRSITSAGGGLDSPDDPD